MPTEHRDFAKVAVMLYNLFRPRQKREQVWKPETQKRTKRRHAVFLRAFVDVCLIGRRWRRSLRACWFAFVCQSSNSAICRPPRLEAKGGLTTHERKQHA